MPLPLPNLDTRRFDDLVDEMRTLIPHYAPDWTNHNPSDPGIALVELLAWLTEATLYRLNQIPQATYLNFLTALFGEGPKDNESFGEFRRRVLKAFYEPHRAVTADDFEREAKAASVEVARVKILSDDAEGQVTVVLVPAVGSSPTAGASPTHQLVRAVKVPLDERKLVGTKVRVRGPIYTAVRLDVTVVPEINTIREEIKDAVEDAIWNFLDPLMGGSKGCGWPFGRPLTVFDLYHVIEPILGVDHVEEIALNGNRELQDVSVSELPSLAGLSVEMVEAAQ